jgi:hypothetical protein
MLLACSDSEAVRDDSDHHDRRDLLVPAYCHSPSVQKLGGRHRAIAFSPSAFGGSDTAARGVGTSWGWFNSQEARSTALRACSLSDPYVSDCRVELTINRGCGALAVGTRGVSAMPAAGRGPTVRAAQAAAVQACSRNAQACRIAATTCARFRDRP